MRVRVRVTSERSWAKPTCDTDVTHYRCTRSVRWRTYQLIDFIYKPYEEAAKEPYIDDVEVGGVQEDANEIRDVGGEDALNQVGILGGKGARCNVLRGEEGGKT